MNDTFEQVYSYFRMVWRYHWLALACAFAVCLIGWVAIAMQPNRFEVTSSVYIESNSMLQPLLKGLAVESELVKDMSQIMRQSMLSKPNLKEVARITGMDKKTDSPEDLDYLIEEFERDLIITGTKEKGIYTITYQNKNPQLAQRIVETLLKRFFDSVSDISKSDSDIAKRFLDQQIGQYKVKLEDAEQKLKVFKEKYVGLMPEDGRTFFNRLEQLKSQYQTAKLELQEAENGANSVRGQLASIEASVTNSSTTSTPALVPSPIDQRIVELESTLDDLLLRFTDRHPDVIATRRTIEQLKKEKMTSFQQSGGVTGSASNVNVLLTNPLYQNLKTQLGTAEASVAALRTRVTEYKRRLEETERAMGTAPEIEAELAQLNRDYDVHKENYQTLVQRRESATISNDADAANELKFNILEPPQLPLRPVSPNRLKWNTLILILGLGTGVLLALLLSQMRPLIYSKKDLRDLVDIPVLGGVSLINTWQKTAANSVSNISFYLAFIALILIYLALTVMNQFGSTFISNIAVQVLLNPLFGFV